jgi:hypothetical protein
VEVLRHSADAAKSLVSLANEEAFSRKREADEDRMKLEGRLGELARLSQANANSGRAKAAEFVVERLKAARERVEHLERKDHEQQIELREQQQLVSQYQQQHRAGLLGQASGDSGDRGAQGQQLLVARLQDELREIREVCDPEHAHEQSRVMQTLYAELRAERRLVAQLEAVLACGAADELDDGRSNAVAAASSAAGVPFAGGYPLPQAVGATGGPRMAADGMLAQLLDGLQLKQLEDQVEALSASALEELGAEMPPPPLLVRHAAQVSTAADSDPPPALAAGAGAAAAVALSATAAERETQLREQEGARRAEMAELAAVQPALDAEVATKPVDFFETSAAAVAAPSPAEGGLSTIATSDGTQATETESPPQVAGAAEELAPAAEVPVDGGSPVAEVPVNRSDASQAAAAELGAEAAPGEASHVAASDALGGGGGAEATEAHATIGPEAAQSGSVATEQPAIAGIGAEGAQEQAQENGAAAPEASLPQADLPADTDGA